MQVGSRSSQGSSGEPERELSWKRREDVTLVALNVEEEEAGNRGGQVALGAGKARKEVFPKASRRKAALLLP